MSCLNQSDFHPKTGSGGNGPLGGSGAHRHNYLLKSREGRQLASDGSADDLGSEAMNP